MERVLLWGSRRGWCRQGQSCRNLSSPARESAASRSSRCEEEEGQSLPSSALERGCPPRARLAHGVPPPPLETEDGCPQPGWQHRGVTPPAAAGSRGFPGVGVGVLVGAGVHHSVRRGFQGVPAPSGILAGCKPPSRHPARLVKTQTPSPRVCGFLPGLGGAPGTRLCQGLVISSEDVSELLGLAGEITELLQLPIPPCLAFGKFPFSSLKSPWVERGVTTAPLMLCPGGEGAAEPPWVAPGWEQGSASGAPAGCVCACEGAVGEMKHHRLQGAAKGLANLAPSRVWQRLPPLELIPAGSAQRGSSRDPRKEGLCL